MTIRNLLWVLCFALLLFGPYSLLATYSQAEQGGKITFQMLSQKLLPPAKASSRRIVIKRAKEIRIGALINKDDKRILSFTDRADVTLPHDLPALVAKDGSMILQFGDEQDLSHPSVTNLYWLNSEGKEMAGLRGYYRADALVSLSEDGFVAVTGNLVEGPQGKFLSMFDGQGKRLWEIQVGEGREVHAEPVVAPQGNRVALVATDSKSPLRRHRILIIDEQGKEVQTVNTMGIVQKIVAVGSGKALFIQGSERHGLIDLSTGSLSWSKEGNLRLIAPRAAALSPNGDVLFLLLAQWRGRPQAKYRWQLKALDASDGSVLGVFDLPKEKPGTRTDVFDRITEDQIGILYGQEHYFISWSR